MKSLLKSIMANSVIMKLKRLNKKERIIKKDLVPYNPFLFFARLEQNSYHQSLRDSLQTLRGLLCCLTSYHQSVSPTASYLRGLSLPLDKKVDAVGRRMICRHNACLSCLCALTVAHSLDTRLFLSPSKHSLCGDPDCFISPVTT